MDFESSFSPCTVRDLLQVMNSLYVVLPPQKKRLLRDRQKTQKKYEAIEWSDFIVGLSLFRKNLMLEISQSEERMRDFLQGCNNEEIKKEHWQICKLPARLLFSLWKAGDKNWWNDFKKNSDFSGTWLKIKKSIRSRNQFEWRPLSKKNFATVIGREKKVGDKLAINPRRQNTC